MGNVINSVIQSDGRFATININTPYGATSVTLTDPNGFVMDNPIHTGNTWTFSALLFFGNYTATLVNGADTITRSYYIDAHTYYEFTLFPSIEPPSDITNLFHLENSRLDEYTNLNLENGSFVDAKFGKGLSVGSYFSICKPLTLIPSFNNNITVECWNRLSSNQSTGNIIMSNMSYVEFSLSRYDSSNIWLHVARGAGASNWTLVGTFSSTADVNWHHYSISLEYVGGSYNEGNLRANIKVFEDGQLKLNLSNIRLGWIDTSDAIQYRLTIGESSTVDELMVCRGEWFREEEFTPPTVPYDVWNY